MQALFLRKTPQVSFNERMPNSFYCTAQIRNCKLGKLCSLHDSSYDVILNLEMDRLPASIDIKDLF